ncbi:CdsA CDP-diglyceride synthetase [Methylophilaceae bacterium]|jgi:phosphatidate cytidylyltransferase
MLKTRVITAVLLFAFFIPALFILGNVSWAYAMLVFCLLGLYEWGGMIQLSSMQNKFYVGFAAFAGLLGVYLLQQFGFHQFFFNSLLVFVIVAIFWFFVVPIWFKTKTVIGNKLLMSALGLLLIASLWLALICAKGADPLLLLLLLATIWIADSAAYFAGKNFGKHKLAPHISPGKTWEGVLGAMIAVTAFGAIIYFNDGLGFHQMVVFPGLWLIVGLGVVGDLFESLMKRQANLKDSGHLLPGHGGILDRVDGIIPSLPIAILMIYTNSYFNTIA